MNEDEKFTLALRVLDFLNLFCDVAENNLEILLIARDILLLTTIAKLMKLNLEELQKPIKK